MARKGLAHETLPCETDPFPYKPGGTALPAPH